ncbi:Retrovirus-related Pol polyprotein from transposon RE1 [Vitis vinifera]|uniref:Retrovirus-related Pol polyprotein from transposon RE1 n=1 Tax=Vitis vinifera TaxID=29760 RepID=A0A438HKC7_VITVI|nr:Retrovirus-related Pol polyprotein from transposon RE1 [Vitis vinifera]
MSEISTNTTSQFTTQSTTPGDYQNVSTSFELNGGNYLQWSQLVKMYTKGKGELIYLSHTRPNIGYAVSEVSQFMHNPKEIHIEAVFRILRYLESTPSKVIQFPKAEGIRLEAYTDADWAR